MKSILILLAILSIALNTVGQSAPNAPEIVICEPFFDPNGVFVHLVWLDNSTDELGFRVERAEARGKKWAAWTMPYSGLFQANLPILWDGLIDPTKTYKYRVRAENAYGVSAWSNEVVFVGPYSK
jgi:hypothetical protein